MNLNTSAEAMLSELWKIEGYFNPFSYIIDTAILKGYYVLQLQEIMKIAETFR